MKTVVICGAGADKAAGMPLAYEIVPEIRKFLKEEGEVIHNTIANAKVLPVLRFDYDKIIDDAVKSLAHDFQTVSSIIEGISKELDGNADNMTDMDVNKGNLIIKLLSMIQNISKGAKVEVELETLIRNVYGDDIPLMDEYLIDTSKIVFTAIFNKVMHNLIEDGLDDPDNLILAHLNRNLIDLEQLLMKYFVGFYTGKMSDIKRYLYLSWTLWAFMKHREDVAVNSGNPIPFYSSLPKDWTIVTLNYTSFARRELGSKALYFHGDLSRFVRMQDRQHSRIDQYDNLKIARFIKETVARNIFLKDVDDPRYVVPSIIPPLQIKPLISSNYIDVWYKSKKAIEEAENIVIVGYSFSFADEHLNDIIRQNKDSNILIVDKYPKNILRSVQNIFSYRPEDYVENSFQGMICYEKGNLKIVGAEAVQIDWNAI